MRQGGADRCRCSGWRICADDEAQNAQPLLAVLFLFSGQLPGQAAGVVLVLSGEEEMRTQGEKKNAVELSVDQKRAVEDWVLGALVP